MFNHAKSITLATCDPLRAFRVERILDQSTPFLDFIQRIGLKPGSRVRVLERSGAGGVVRCKVDNAEATLGLP